MEPRIGFNLSSLSYGDITVGDAVDISLEITNTGDDDLIVASITSSDGQITLPSPVAPVTINPGDTVTQTVRATPLGTGTTSFNLSLSSNAPSTPDVIFGSFHGVTLGTRVLSVDPPNVVFPNTKVGDTSSEILITLINTGSVDLEVSALTFPADFIIGSSNLTLPQTIVPDGSYAFGIKFKPLSEGYVNENVQIVSDTPTTPFLIASEGQAYLIDPAYTIDNAPQILIFGFSTNAGAVTVRQIDDPTDFDTEIEAIVQKLHNFSLYGADKTAKYFFFHYEDFGECDVTVRLYNQVTGATNDYERSIGTVAANEARLLDIFEVTMEGEDIVVAFIKSAGDGSLSVLDYGLKLLPFQEQLGTNANPLTITPAYITTGDELLVFAFPGGVVSLMDADDLNCEEPAYCSNNVLLPFQTESGSVPGFSYEKQVMRVLFHYEDFGEATIRITATSMRGQVSTQEVTIGSVAADEAVELGIADVMVTDEITNIRFDSVEGPLSLVDWVAKYVMKGERKKQDEEA